MASLGQRVSRLTATATHPLRHWTVMQPCRCVAPLQRHLRSSPATAAALTVDCGRRLRSDAADIPVAAPQPVLGNLPSWPSQRSSPSRGSVRAAAAAREKLLKGVDPEFRDDVARVVEAAERAADSWRSSVTDFQPPPVVALATAAVRQLAGVGAVAWGGYPQAERCRLLVGPIDTLPDAPMPDALDADIPAELAEAVVGLRVSGNFMFDAATHRDFLGAVLGAGIDRSKVGDIIVTADRGAQLLVAPQLADFLCEALTQVRSVSVQTEVLPLAELRVAAPRVESRTSVEASMRLDALASAGFRLSRSKLSELIKKGDVRVNWRPAKGSVTLKTGDVISCSGKGRVEIGDVQETKKGKYAVELQRFV